MFAHKTESRNQDVLLIVLTQCMGLRPRGTEGAEVAAGPVCVARGTEEMPAAPDWTVVLIGKRSQEEDAVSRRPSLSMS